jgi:hypothetical protein
MASQLQSKLAPELIDVIKLYTGEAYWHNNNIYYVKKIPKTDDRYAMLKKRPLIKQVPNDYREHPLRGSVWFKVNGKFMVITIRYTHFWDGNSNIFGYFKEVFYNGNKKIIYYG